MGNSTSFEPFNEPGCFDPVLTRIDPSLDIDVFNMFMMCPILPGKIEPQIKMNENAADGLMRPAP